MTTDKTHITTEDHKVSSLQHFELHFNEKLGGRPGGGPSASNNENKCVLTNSLLIYEDENKDEDENQSFRSFLNVLKQTCDTRTYNYTYVV